MGIFDEGIDFLKSNVGSIIGGAVGGTPGSILGGMFQDRFSQGDFGTDAPRGTFGSPGSSILDYKLPTTQLGSNVGVDVYKPQQTQETKQSGEKVISMYENGYTQASFGGALVPFAQSLSRGIFGTGVGGVVGGAVGGALLSQGIESYMGMGDSSGCSPKPFVRLDKCGRPIITRAMQSKAKEMVMCMGIENAAAALGISVPLLAEIAFKKFKPRAKGISGAQLKTAKRVARQMHMAQKQFKAAVAGRKC